MRRFYFHVRRGQLTILDQRGTELAGTQEAAGWGREIALREALNWARSDVGKVIVDDETRTILEVQFEDALGDTD